jgi:exopolysaccharide biosynthesis protein
MSLLEFGSLMLSHGVYQGLNLDGGGSTTMVSEDTIVNSPSDATGERPVANCLVILRRGERRSGGGSPTTGPGGI